MLTPRERERLIKQLWSKKRRDYRSKRGDESHPGILALGPGGTTLVPLRGATDEELIALWDTGHLPGVGRGGAARKFPKGGPCASYKTTPAREKCRARVSAKIGKLLDEGISQSQAVATALSMETAGRLGPRGGYTRTGRRAPTKRALAAGGTPTTKRLERLSVQLGYPIRVRIEESMRLATPRSKRSTWGPVYMGYFTEGPAAGKAFMSEGTGARFERAMRHFFKLYGWGIRR